MKKISFTIATFLTLTAQADIKMLYSKGTPFALGRSYDLNQPFERKENCIDYKETRWAQVSDGALNMSFNSNLISSSTDLTKNLKIGVDLTAKAKFKLVNAQFDLKSELVKNYHSYQDSLTHLVQAEYDFGFKELVEPVLKTEYKALIAEGKHLEFVKRCGTHFVDATQQMVLINMMLKMSNLNSEKKSLIKASFGANGSYAGISADVKARLEKGYEIAQKYGKTSIKVEALGAQADHMNQFGSSNDLSKTLSAMANLMSSVSKDTSMPGSFIFVSMERFGLEAPVYDLFQQEFLNAAFHLSMEYENKLARLSREIIKLESTYRQFGAGQKSLSYFLNLQRKLGMVKRRLDEKVDSCVSEKFCELSELSLLTFDIDWTTDFLTSIEATSHCYYNENEMIGYSKFFDAKLKHFELIKRIDVYRTYQGKRERLPLGINDFSYTTSFSRINGVYDFANSIDQENIQEMVRKAQYEMIVTDRYGMSQNYSINDLSFGNCK